MFKSRNNSSVLWRRDWSGTHPTKCVIPRSQWLTSKPSMAATRVGLSLPLTTISNVCVLNSTHSGRTVPPCDVVTWRLPTLATKIHAGR